LVFIGGIVFNLQPLGTFLDRPYYDFGLAYTNVFYQIGNVKLIRVAGFYNEPGTFAFYTTFALLIARIFGMAKWKEILLIIFGLTSLRTERITQRKSGRNRMNTLRSVFRTATR